MKKLMVGLTALTFTWGIAAFAQQNSMGQSTQGSMGQTTGETQTKAPLKTLRGVVKAEGDKVVFVDENGKSWEVMNPEELKAHEGHQVQVKAHVYADKDAIHVMHVKMLKSEPKTSEPMAH